MSDAIRKMYRQLQEQSQAPAGADERAYRMLNASANASVDGPSIAAAAGPRGPDEQGGFWPHDLTPVEQGGMSERMRSDVSPRESFGPVGMRMMTEEDKRQDLREWAAKKKNRELRNTPIGPVAPDGTPPARPPAPPAAASVAAPAAPVPQASRQKKLRDFEESERAASEARVGDWEKGLKARLEESRREADLDRADRTKKTERQQAGRPPSEPLTEKDRQAADRAKAAPPEEKGLRGTPSRIRDYRRRIAENGLDSEGNPLPGVLTPMQQRQLDEGGALPEGLSLNSYPVEQATTMGRDVNNPAAATLPFGGTFTHHPDGATSTRALDDQISPSILTMKNDELRGEVLSNAAAQLGIDASQYGPQDEAILQAHVRRAAERHLRMQEVARVKRNEYGTPYYAADPKRAEDALEAKENAYPRQRRMQFANEMIERHGLTGADADMARKLAMSDDENAFRDLRESDQTMRLDARSTTRQKLADRWKNINMSRDVNNPTMAPGMYIRSLQDAVQSGDPLRIAAVHETFGRHDAARDAMALAGQRAQLEAQERSEKRALDAANPKPKAAAEELDAALAGVLRPGVVPGPREMLAVEEVMERLHPSEGDPEKAKANARRAREYVTDHVAVINPNHPIVKEKLQHLAEQGWPSFRYYTTQVMKMSERDAAELWRKTASTASQMWWMTSD